MKKSNVKPIQRENKSTPTPGERPDGPYSRLCCFKVLRDLKEGVKKADNEP